jgi:hypothetical protein
MTEDELYTALRSGTHLVGTDQWGHVYKGALDRRTERGGWVLAFRVDPTGKTVPRHVVSAVTLNADELDYLYK